MAKSAKKAPAKKAGSVTKKLAAMKKSNAKAKPENDKADATLAAKAAEASPLSSQPVTFADLAAFRAEIEMNMRKQFHDIANRMQAALNGQPLVPPAGKKIKVR